MNRHPPLPTKLSPVWRNNRHPKQQLTSAVLIVGHHRLKFLSENLNSASSKKKRIEFFFSQEEKTKHATFPLLTGGSCLFKQNKTTTKKEKIWKENEEKKER